ncbi:MAG: urea ABC transporter permease subunit UrtB [Pseudomonadota bacterium]
MIYKLLVTAFLAFNLITHLGLAEETPADFETLLAQLTTKKFNEKEIIIGEIASSGHEQALPVLTRLLEGEVYYRKDDKKIVFVDIVEKDALVTDIISGEDLGTLPKKKVKKVGINNKLRGVLKGAIARLSLNNQDPEVRRAAVVEMFENLDNDTILLIEERLPKEEDDDVIEVLNTALAISNLKSQDRTTVLAAVETLSKSLHPEARTALTSLKTNLSEQPSTPQSQEITSAIDNSLHYINSSVGWYKQIENVFFGVSLGSVLLLAAVGLAITFGVMGVINMAHGEMLMLGAYTTYIIQQVFPSLLQYSLLISIPVAFVFTAIVGIAIERGVIRFMYGRPLETLLATFGISLILQQAVRTLISPQNRAVATPDFMSGSLEINPALSLTYNRLYIIIFAFLVLAGLMLLLKKTNFGLQIRAVTQNRTMAKAMGIRTDWVDALTFGLGSGIAGMAGVALSQLTNVGPNLGQGYIIDSFMVVVFGGVGNLWGTLFGAMTLGIANKFLEPFTGAVVAKILILVLIILFIQKRPRGMFALKGRSAES